MAIANNVFERRKRQRCCCSHINHAAAITSLRQFACDQSLSLQNQKRSKHHRKAAAQVIVGQEQNSFSSHSTDLRTKNKETC